MMNAIIIPTSICFTQIKHFCHVLKTTSRIKPLVSVQNSTPSFCKVREVNAVGFVNFNGFHGVFGVEQCKYGRDLMRTQDPLGHFKN